MDSAVDYEFRLSRFGNKDFHLLGGDGFSGVLDGDSAGEADIGVVDIDSSSDVGCVVSIAPPMLMLVLEESLSRS